MVALYDQQHVRRVDGRAWRRLAGRPLCGVCGDLQGCTLRIAVEGLAELNGAAAEVQECESYVPVLSFQDLKGTDEHFNTFRRGRGWFNRVSSGNRIRLTGVDNQLAGTCRVEDTHAGPLSDLLRDHARMNHLMLDDPWPELSLARELVRIYGKNWAALEAEFSVIYLRRIE